MMKFLHWFRRALFAILVLALLASIWISWSFQQWKKERLSALDAGSKIVQTAAGPIEYTESGSGPALLISHGAPGGYDQAALIGAMLAREGFRVIAPSRPGFLRTPLTTSLLFDEQADALVALLDTLKIKNASVLGFSTGAQVAVQIALRHPERITSLLLLSPVTRSYQGYVSNQERQILPDAALSKITGDMGAWFFVRESQNNPNWMLNSTFAIDTTLSKEDRKSLVDFVLQDSAQLIFFRNLIGTLAPLSPRESGTRNDLVLLRALEPIAYEKIQAPTLLVHGTDDAGGDWNAIEEITKKLPSAQVLEVEDAGQLIWFGPNAAATQQAILNFLTNPTLPNPSTVPPSETDNQDDDAIPPEPTSPQ